ncbi:MAG: D-alanyl-D-alanine carboxypeptidase/D-alanyl-D-alanine endopeptidase [Gemmatimonadaceae bacterium]
MRLALWLFLVSVSYACASAGGRGAAQRSSRAQLTQFIDSSLADARFRSAQWGVLVVDAERGDTLYSRNAGKLFMPASNQKLLTGAVALDVLGPSYRYATHFAAGGAISDSVLQGDLIVRGSGDPTVSDAMQRDAMLPLRAMAESLYVRGVRRVAGRLASAGDAFPAPAYGFGWSWDDLDFPYSAGVDELMFNEGFARVRIRAGPEADSAVTAGVAPARDYPRVRMLAKTVARGDTTARQGRRLRVYNDSAALGTLIVDGTIVAGDSIERRIAFRDQRHAYLAALREAIVDRGIVVDSSEPGWIANTTNGAREPVGIPLFSWRSDSLGLILPSFEKPSQNQIGELLLRTIGLNAGTSGTPAEGARIVTDALLAWGAARDGFRVRDGSGLSRHNVVSPETILRVLDALRRSPNFQLFRDALPIAGVDGTIGNRMRGTAAATNLRAKTGTLDMVRSLSGYVTAADGRLLMFSILCNNWLVEVREVDRVADAIGVRLAELRLDRR